MLNKSDPPADRKEPVVIKKYANRRLYNTETSTYVTLDDLAVMVKGERDFVVFDAKSGDDLTHSVLTQIIVDQESRMGSQTLLPIPFLRQLIRFYGDSIERLVPSYLQVSLDTLTKEQERFRKSFAGAFTPAGAFEAYQEQARKNLAMFEQAMKMFSPFTHAKPPGKPEDDVKKPESDKGAAAVGGLTSPSGASGGQTSNPTSAPGSGQASGQSSSPAGGQIGNPSSAPTGAAASGQGRGHASDIAELKAELANMQKKLDKLSGGDN
jgi:polyhydroxyalkanoate synthesis repressor PhaR